MGETLRQAGRKIALEGRIYTAARTRAFQAGMALPTGERGMLALGIVVCAKGTETERAGTGFIARGGDAEAIAINDPLQRWAKDYWRCQDAGNEAAARRLLFEGLESARDNALTGGAVADVLLPASELQLWKPAGKTPAPLLCLAEDRELRSQLVAVLFRVMPRLCHIVPGVVAARRSPLEAKNLLVQAQKNLKMAAEALAELKAAASADLHMGRVKRQLAQEWERVLERDLMRDAEGRQRPGDVATDLLAFANGLAEFTGKYVSLNKGNDGVDTRELVMRDSQLPCTKIPAGPSSKNGVLAIYLNGIAAAWQVAGGIAGTSGERLSPFHAFAAAATGFAAGTAAAWRGRNIEGAADPFRMLQMDVAPSREKIRALLIPAQ